MKLGVSCSTEWLPYLKAAGYDYIEYSFCGLATASNEEALDIYKQLQHYGIPAEAYNCFFAPDAILYENADLAAIGAYADKGLARAKELGGKIAVIGSGRARSIPEGMDRKAGAEQFARVLHVCGDAAAKHGIELVIEPLRYAESNFIHTVTEGIEIAKLANHPNVGMLVDFYHFTMNEEPLENLELLDDTLRHVHIARGNADRGAPRAEDEETVRKWAASLKAKKYDARLTLECRFSEDVEGDLRRAKPLMELFR